MLDFLKEIFATLWGNTNKLSKLYMLERFRVFTGRIKHINLAQVTRLKSSLRYLVLHLAEGLIEVLSERTTALQEGLVV